MTPDVRIAIVGAGQIGRRHCDAVQQARSATVAAIVDPADTGRAFAEMRSVPWFASLAAMFRSQRPDGVVIATPNAMHVAHGLECVALGVPALVEKPFATSVDDGLRLIDAARLGGVPLLTGHHRRHNPLIAKAKALIAGGALGDIVAVHTHFWLRKPDPYFDVEWRRQAAAGPILLNCIHDIDLMRHLVGDIVSVQAMASNRQRGFDVEDSAAFLLRFASGAIGTATVSDAVAAPWSWELTAGENPAYPVSGENCYRIGGTLASLDLPSLALWRHADDGGWMSPISATRFPAEQADPLVRQIEHFAAVIRGEAKPLVSGEDGLAAVAVIEAINEAARTGASITVDDIARRGASAQ